MTTANRPASEDDVYAQNFKRLLDGLLGLSGMTDKELILRLGMPRSTFFRKCTDGSWKGREIERLAEALDVTPDVFFLNAEEVRKNIALLMEAHKGPFLPIPKPRESDEVGMNLPMVMAF
jgi:hypothetical protein